MDGPECAAVSAVRRRRKCAGGRRFSPSIRSAGAPSQWGHGTGEGRCSPGLRPGSVRGLRLCRLAAGDLRAPRGPDPPIEHESGDRQDKRRRERGDPMEQKVHNGRPGGGERRNQRRRSKRLTTPRAVGAQKTNIHLTRSLFTCASRCSSLASKRAKLSSFSSRRSARYVASTALNQAIKGNAECEVRNAELQC